MTTNPYAEAIEAAAQAMLPSKCLCRACINPARRHAEAAVDAAVPHLLAPIRALADDFRDNVDWSDGRSNYGDNEAYEACARRLTQALDAIEAGATSEGARDA